MRTKSCRQKAHGSNRSSAPVFLSIPFDAVTGSVGPIQRGIFLLFAYANKNRRFAACRERVDRPTRRRGNPAAILDFGVRGQEHRSSRSWARSSAIGLKRWDATLFECPAGPLSARQKTNDRRWSAASSKSL